MKILNVILVQALQPWGCLGLHWDWQVWLLCPQSSKRSRHMIHTATAAGEAGTADTPVEEVVMEDTAAEEEEAMVTNVLDPDTAQPMHTTGGTRDKL